MIKEVLRFDTSCLELNLTMIQEDAIFILTLIAHGDKWVIILLFTIKKTKNCINNGYKY